MDNMYLDVSPAQLGGRGLKLWRVDRVVGNGPVSPAQLGGRGLKLQICRRLLLVRLYRPLSWAGAD